MLCTSSCRGRLRRNGFSPVRRGDMRSAVRQREAARRMPRSCRRACWRASADVRYRAPAAAVAGVYARGAPVARLRIGAKRRSSAFDMVLVKAPVESAASFFIDTRRQVRRRSGPPYPCYDAWITSYLSGISAFNETRSRSPRPQTESYRAVCLGPLLDVSPFARLTPAADPRRLRIRRGGPDGGVAVSTTPSAAALCTDADVLGNRFSRHEL